MPENVFLNGKYCESHEAMVSVDDRGFLFGDGVYEVIRCYRGALFKLQEHLSRFARSAARIDLVLPYSAEEIAAICKTLLARSGVKNGMLYMQVTRGSAPRTHEFPSVVTPTIMMKVREIDEQFFREKKKGVSVLTVPDERWEHCDIKSLNLLPNVLAKQKARSQGFHEAVFIHEPGVTECASSNIFIVTGGTVVTAPEGNRILSGITREVVLKLAGEAGIPCELRYPQKNELYKAEEVFFSNTMEEIIPVLAVDGNVINQGKPGNITLRLQEMFKKLVDIETS